MRRKNQRQACHARSEKRRRSLGDEIREGRLKGRRKRQRSENCGCRNGAKKPDQKLLPKRLLVWRNNASSTIRIEVKKLKLKRLFVWRNNASSTIRIEVKKLKPKRLLVWRRNALMRSRDWNKKLKLKRLFVWRNNVPSATESKSRN